MFNKSSVYDFRLPGVSSTNYRPRLPAYAVSLESVALPSHLHIVSPCHSIKCLGQPWKHLVTLSKKQDVPLFYVPLGPGGRGGVESLYKARSPRQYGVKVKVQGERASGRRSQEPGECVPQAGNMSTSIVRSSVALSVRTPWVPAQAL